MATYRVRAIGGGLVVGSASAVLLYGLLAPTPDPYADPIPVPTVVPGYAPTTFRPCRPPSRLEDGVCVTHVRRTVTVTSTPPLSSADDVAPAPALGASHAPSLVRARAAEDAHEEADDEEQEDD